MKWQQRWNGRQLPVGGRDYNLLGMLLEPLIHVCQHTGRRIVLRTTRQQIARYWHLIDDSV